jgi:Bacterial extracellular solute-binding proteins, family 3
LKSVIFRHIFFVFFLNLVLSLNAYAVTLRYNKGEDPNADYCIAMLKLALAKVGGDYQFEPVYGEMTQTRQVEDVKNGKLEVMWAGTSKELEDEVEPVRVPLFKGLLGHRFLIIRKGDQARFNNVKNISDLRNIALGQGTAWIDTKVLEANQLKVVKTMKYQNLFYMLDGARFDAFPRAVFEPFNEIASRPNLNLTVEENLMLVYKMDFYLFVSKDNKKLARDLERGLDMAIADGSFDEIFMSSPLVQEAISKGNLKNRIVIPLDNPFNSPETPIDRAEYWIDPKSL